MDAIHSSAASSDAGSSPVKCGKVVPKGRWSSEVRETLFSSGRDGLLHVTILGGSEHDSFCYISDADEERLNVHSGRLHRDDVILEIQGENVAGFTRQDLLDWLWSVSRNHSPVLMKTVSSAFLMKSLSKFLTLRFMKDSVDQSLQQVIRKNVYRKALPCTTRAARQGELDGVDYKFLTVDEFLTLEKSGGLLESGIYNGNYYGTPKPQVPVHPRGKPYTGQSSSSSCPVEHHIDGRLEEQKQGLPPISSISSTIQHEKDEEEEKEDADKSSSAVGSTSQKPPSDDRQMTSVGDGMTDVVIGSDPLGNHLHHPVGQTSLLTQLPYGWEKVIDPDYGVYYIDHINRKTQYDFPVALSCSSVDAAVSSVTEVENMKENNLEKENRNSSSGARACSSSRLCLSRNNIELKGDFIKTQLMKSSRGLGFTIVSADDSDVELLQIKTILPNGSADIDGRLQRGDVLVYVDSHCVVGFTHQDVITLFQSIPIGSKVTLEVCRGYPLPFDPDDPSTEVITTVAVTLPANRNPPPAPAALHYTCGRRSASGAADTGTGHLPLIPMPPPPPPLSCAHSLLHQQLPPLGGSSPAEKAPRTSSRDADKRNEASLSSVGLTELTAVVVKGCDGFGFTIADSSVGQKIKQVLDHDRCRSLAEGDVITEVNGLNVRNLAHGDVVELLKNCPTDTEAVLVIQRGGGHSLRRHRQSSRTRQSKEDSASTSVINTFPVEGPVTENRNEDERRNSGSLGLCASQTASDLETNRMIPLLPHSHLHQSIRSPFHKERSCDSAVDKQMKKTVSNSENLLLASQCISGTPDFITASAFHNPLEDLRHDPISGHHLAIDKKCNTEGVPHIRSPFTGRSSKKRIPFSGDPGCAGCKVEFGDLLTNEAMHVRNFDGPTTGTSEFSSAAVVSSGGHPALVQDGIRWTVRLERQESGFGIRIVGGIEEGSQVAIGYIVPGGAADAEGHLEIGDEILAVNQQSVIGASHHQVVSLMSQSARLGFVVIDVWKRESPLLRKTMSAQTKNLFDVTLTRKDGEGFGFVIVSSVTKAGSIVGKILDGSPAGRCEQLQVGDSILAINSVDIGNMPHQEVVNFIKASGLSIVLTVAPVNHSGTENRSGQMQNLPHPQTEFFHLIELRRGSRGFGFSIRGGKEFDGMPLYILKIADDGPAQIDGRLQVGDQIIEINGCNTVDILHTEAIDIIQNSGASLSLLIKRSANIQHIATHEHSSAIPSEALNQNSENIMRSARKESQKQTKVKKPNSECHSKNLSST